MDSPEVFKGSYSIEKYLFGSSEPKPGCWVKGQTVVGNMTIAGRVVKCFTRPIYAYLVYCGAAKGSSNDVYIQRQAFSTGFSTHFLSDLAMPFAFPPAVERVNGLSQIVSGVPATTLWAAPGQIFEDIYLDGVEPYAVYQVHMAYVHRPLADSLKMVKADPGIASVFCEAGGQSVLVSSVALVRGFAIQARHAVDPLEWGTIKTRVLDGVAKETWQFDETASQSSSHCY
ncbi:monalysin family beta-barrel pore-forming toxin [Pseudomonas alkylphenolica]|uniref:Monalysin family beta-barrel pore-forming toxin n=1 Tax=Pseudomonas alkylphenolica TaxID=237609 RepID=A0A443ZXA0_9PSED|nr:monalysin family beta-barrel pore-forming toxin [Pseudomonas alkylphenolica]RWU25325.1 monalysin family beta-barrel pore-forming toxin [Pseudomonas alkylphenolica]